jgi:putative oxidoreductase
MTNDRLVPYGAFVLRVALGVMFISHAYLKFYVFTLPGFEAYLTQVGLSSLLAWPIILAEFFGGLAILTGFYGSLVSLAFLPMLLGVVSVHAPNGWVFNVPNGGWEYPAFLMVGALVQGLLGDGAFALKSFPLSRIASGKVFLPAA